MPRRPKLSQDVLESAAKALWERHETLIRSDVEDALNWDQLDESAKSEQRDEIVPVVWAVLDCIKR